MSEERGTCYRRRKSPQVNTPRFVAIVSTGDGTRPRQDCVKSLADPEGLAVNDVRVEFV